MKSETCSLPWLGRQSKARWVLAPPSLRCENEREVPAASLDGGVGDFCYDLAAAVFLQKKVQFLCMCVCVYLASGAGWVSAGFFAGDEGAGQPHLSLLARIRTVQGLERGRWGM